MDRAVGEAATKASTNKKFRGAMKATMKSGMAAAAKSSGP